MFPGPIRRFIDPLLPRPSSASSLQWLYEADYDNVICSPQMDRIPGCQIAGRFFVMSDGVTMTNSIDDSDVNQLMAVM